MALLAHTSFNEVGLEDISNFGVKNEDQQQMLHAVTTCRRYIWGHISVHGRQGGGSGERHAPSNNLIPVSS